MQESLRLNVNGKAAAVEVAPGSRLLDVLREHLGLVGSKEACGRGECGACTVLIDGRPVASCLVMAETVSGAVTTIEGLADEFADLRRAFAVKVERWNAHGHGVLRLERAGTGWRVDGAPRPDLNGAEEPDLSVTPFCNTFPIRRTPADAGASLTLDTAFVDGPALTVARSRQRYDRQGPGRVRYVDLGLSQGFEADLVVDETGLVLHYEHLFERVTPPAP